MGNECLFDAMVRGSWEDKVCGVSRHGSRSGYTRSDDRIVPEIHVFFGGSSFDPASVDGGRKTGRSKDNPDLDPNRRRCGP